MAERNNSLQRINEAVARTRGELCSPELDRMLDTAQAAAFLGLRPQTLRKWRWRGGGPLYVRRGNGTRATCGYWLSSLQEWLAARTFANTTVETAGVGGGQDE